MKFKILCSGLAVLLLAAMMPACGSPPVDREMVTQISTIQALINGAYDGVTSFGELKKYGDTGIGTFAALDGEMLEIDGVVYQIKADGKAYQVADSALTPFAAVTYFDTDRTLELASGTTYAQLQSYLDGVLPTLNIFYAFEISGTFSYMKTRSVPAQAKPYPLLTEVTKNQPVFEFNSVQGTIVGFRCPSYVSGVNVAGYHLHFLTADKTAGGHILDFTVTQAEARVDYTSDFRMLLPGSGEFYNLDLSGNASTDIARVEK